VLITLRKRVLHLRTPLVTAHGSTTERHVIEISVRDGTFCGYGEAAPLPGFGLESFQEAEAGLQNWVRDPEQLPASPAALSGAVTALEYLELQKEGICLPAASIAVQALVGASEASDVEAQVAQAVASGYSAVKLKVATTKTSVDIDRIQVAAAVTNGETLLRLDANGGWSSDEALKVLTAVSDTEIELIEEPTRDPSEWREIGTRTGLKVGADEQLTDRLQIDRILELEAAQTFVLKPSVLGGPESTRQLASRAQDHNVRVLISSLLEGPIGLRTARDLAIELAPQEIHGLGTAALFIEDLPEDVSPVNGRIFRR
jgi:o-succinylbenzoate synthase